MFNLLALFIFWLALNGRLTNYVDLLKNERLR